MTRHYCCYFDHRYLPKGLAMIESLRAFDENSPVWVLCLDELCYEMMAAIAVPNARLIAMSEFEAGDEALAVARSSRSLIEYYFTCTPSLVRFVLKRCAANDTVTYVDGDLFFFSDPICLHDELGRGSVSLIPHRFPEALRQREVYGLYNVGWLTFRNDSNGSAAVEWWRERCNEWCYDRWEGERFADQKYLDRFPALFGGVVILRNEGANVAPWNLGRYEIARRGGNIYVRDGVPLVFFHFHGLKQSSSFCCTIGLREYGVHPTRAVRRELYRPYVNRIVSIGRALERDGLGRAQSLQRGLAQAVRAKGLWARVHGALRDIKALAQFDALLVIAGRAL